MNVHCFSYENYAIIYMYTMYIFCMRFFPVVRTLALYAMIFCLAVIGHVDLNFKKHDLGFCIVLNVLLSEYVPST